MTDETDLLPLPDAWRWEGQTFLPPVYLAEHMQAYARANLAELQREVEGLRRDRDDCLAAREHYAGLVGQMTGEVEGLRAHNAAAKEMLNRPEHAHLRGAHLHGRVADCLLCDAMADRERLAGALRELADEVFGKRAGDEPDVYADYDRMCALERKARAALDQETTNG